MVTPPRLEPRSTWCQPCTLTATPKSQARWYGSQSTYSSVVTITSSQSLYEMEQQKQQFNPLKLWRLWKVIHTISYSQGSDPHLFSLSSEMKICLLRFVVPIQSHMLMKVRSSTHSYQVMWINQSINYLTLSNHSLSVFLAIKQSHHYIYI